MATITRCPPKRAEIELDTTVADLCLLHGLDGPMIATMHCVFARLDLHPEFPREVVFPEDAEPVPYSDDDPLEQDRLRKVILAFKPLRRCFGLGNMEVILLGPSITATSIDRALSQLVAGQRHRPVMIDLDAAAVPEQLVRAISGKKLLFWRPQGWMRRHDCLVDPYEAFAINSKQFLLTSGIRTPPSRMLSLAEALDSKFATQPLPFVVKLPRAGCGFGTFLVTSDEKRRHTIAALAKYRDQGVADIILSDYIDSVQDLSVHFFIGAPHSSQRNRQNPLIMGVTVQTLTDDGKWVGGYIDYEAQAQLRHLVWDTVLETTRRLPVAFVGWAGIDIVVDKCGRQWVVDLNARFTGSMPICLMSNHFHKRRALPLAQFAAFTYSGAEDEVYDVLEPLLSTGQVVITATSSIDQGENMADVVWGAKDRLALAQVGDWIQKKLTSRKCVPIPA